ncbi:MAG: type II toxin-antitoxin system Phd/YefM family antitoxin [Caldilineaceae bacterium]
MEINYYKNGGILPPSCADWRRKGRIRITKESEMSHFSLQEAEQNLARLIALVHQGEQVVIEANGKPVAQLMLPIDASKKRQPGAILDDSLCRTISMIHCRMKSSRDLGNEVPAGYACLALVEQ